MSDIIPENDKNVTFQEELRSLLNRACRENESNTPDFLLAEYMLDTLRTFERTVSNRDAWYGFKPWERLNSTISLDE